jgi:hypothetical protein
MESNGKRLLTRRLMIVLLLIKKNNYYFIQNEDRATFEIHLKNYRENLPDKYQIIARKFELNPNRWNEAPPQQIIMPKNILNQLQTTNCSDGKSFIDRDTSEYPLKWLQNKQLARVLLTHNKIKGTMTIAEINRQTPKFFVDKNNNPFHLAKNKHVQSTDLDLLQKILATL